jgi:hypothetical protein
MNTILMQPSFNSEPIPIQVSVVDAANPLCLVDSATLPGFFHQEGSSSPETLDFVERIRREAAVLMEPREKHIRSSAHKRNIEDSGPFKASSRESIGRYQMCCIFNGHLGSWQFAIDRRCVSRVCGLHRGHSSSIRALFSFIWSDAKTG